MSTWPTSSWSPRAIRNRSASWAASARRALSRRSASSRSSIPLKARTTRPTGAWCEEPGATFVTLRWRSGDLQGCIGSLERDRAIVDDVAYNAIAAGMRDPRTKPCVLADVDNLLRLLDRLVDSGKTVIVIEHHQAVMAHADWIIDLGPGAGHDGGRIVFEGTPADLVAARSTLTGEHLAAYVGS